MAIYRPPSSGRQNLYSPSSRDRLWSDLERSTLGYQADRRGLQRQWGQTLSSLPLRLYETYRGLKEKRREDEFIAAQAQAKQDRDRFDMYQGLPESVLEALQGVTVPTVEDRGEGTLLEIMRRGEDELLVDPSVAVPRPDPQTYAPTMTIGSGHPDIAGIEIPIQTAEMQQALKDEELAAKAAQAEAERLSARGETLWELEQQKPTFEYTNVFVKQDGETHPWIIESKTSFDRNEGWTTTEGFRKDSAGENVRHKDDTATTLSQIDHWNAKTGQMERFWVEEGTGKRISFTPQPVPESVVKEPSQSQWDAARFGYDTQKGSEYIEKAFEEIVGQDANRFMAILKGIEVRHGRFLPYMFQDDALRRYFQGAQMMINAQLRRESGAAISPTEFEAARGQYLPVPGDEPGLIENKREARRARYQTDMLEAGNAWNLHSQYRMNLGRLGEQVKDPETGKSFEWQQDPDDLRVFGWVEIQD